MKNILYMIKIIISLLIVLCGFCYWYCSPRKIIPHLEYVLPIPNKTFDMYNCKSYLFIQDSSDLFLYLLDDKSFSIPDRGFRDSDVRMLNEKLNYKDNSYILTWNRKLVNLRYSPYLTRHSDGLYFDARTPLFPIFDSTKTNNLFLYSIPKTMKYRAPGP